MKFGKAVLVHRSAFLGNAPAQEGHVHAQARFLRRYRSAYAARDLRSRAATVAARTIIFIASG